MNRRLVSKYIRALTKQEANFVAVEVLANMKLNIFS